MLIDSGVLFTNQLFQCFTAVDRKRFDYAELLIWLVLADLKSKREQCEDDIKYHCAPHTEKHSILESAIWCLRQREQIINNVMKDLDEHRPW